MGSSCTRLKDSSLIISDPSFKKCSAQVGLPGYLTPCAETLACEGILPYTETTLSRMDITIILRVEITPK